MANSSVEVFSHKADSYHTYRIAPPQILVELAQSVLNGHPPTTVVDLGCGTGLSTLIWAGVAQKVIGIEPNPHMRQVAEELISTHDLSNAVSLLEGSGEATGLADSSVDLVACSQSLHWMELERTHPEIVRILHPEGALLAFGYDMLPTIRPEIEMAYNAVLSTTNTLIRERALWPQLTTWSFRHQLPIIRAAQWYQYVKEAFFHQAIEGTAEWLVGLVLNYGSVARALAKGISQEELGIPQFQRIAEKILGKDSHTFLFHYKMIIAVK